MYKEDIMATKKQVSKKTTTAVANVAKEVEKKIMNMQANGEIDIPPNYSYVNALNVAWMKILDTKDRNKRPALEVCTKSSISLALLDMVIQGLNPAKDQCYPMVYGNKLVMQKSYFGYQMLAKRIRPEIDKFKFYIVYKDDKFEWEIINGKIQITKHKQTLESINSKKIVAAYAHALTADGEILETEIMTFEQIKEAWRKSPVSPVTDKGNIKAGSTHEKFLDQMAGKTVINRLCKHIINSSDDSYLKTAAIRQDVEAVDGQITEQEDIDLENAEVIDIVEDEEPDNSEEVAKEKEEIRTGILDATEPQGEEVPF